MRGIFKYIGVFLVVLIYQIAIDNLPEILSDIGDLDSKDWKDILIGFIFFSISVIYTSSKFKNKSSDIRMIVIEERRTKKTSTIILILITFICVGVFSYYKSPRIFKYCILVVAWIIADYPSHILESGISEDGIIYEGHLIRWTDIISFEWKKSKLKIIALSTLLGFNMKKHITIAVTDDTVWKKYIG